MTCEPDMAMIHSLLSRIPSHLPIEKLISDACDLFTLHPPNAIKDEADTLYKQYVLLGQLNSSGI